LNNSAFLCNGSEGFSLGFGKGRQHHRGVEDILFRRDFEPTWRTDLVAGLNEVPLSFKCAIAEGKAAFRIHSQIRKLLQADAEGGEQADARFSRHFIEKPDCSLSAIDHLHNRGVIRDIVRSASYLEGSADKIVDYMKANRLTKRKYYLWFLERSSFAKRSSRH
jgi:hypothetical protein